MAGLDQPGMSPILHVCAAGNENSEQRRASRVPCQLRPGQHRLGRRHGLATITTRTSATTARRRWTWRHPGALAILTTVPNNRYDLIFGGTSAAAPQVTAAAALVWSAFPGLTAAQVKQRILSGVDPIGHIGNN